MAIIKDKEGKDTGEATGPDENYLPWIGRQMAIGLADTPGSFASIYGLAGAAKDYLWDRTDPTATPAKGFAENMLDPNGGMEKLQEYNKGVINSIRQARPTATDKEVADRFDEITKHSKRYFEETTPFYRSGIAFGRKWGKGTMETLGDPRLPSERTQADTLLNIAGGAVVPVPGEALLAPVQKGITAVAGRTAGKVGTYAAEALTPATLIPKGATGGEIATRMGANVAVPEAIDQTVRTYKDDPSFVGDTIKAAKDFYTKDDGSAEVGRLGATGVVGTIIAGLAARRLANIRTPSVTPPSAGPTSQAMTQAINPTVNEFKMGAAHAGSDIEPLKVMGKHAGVSDDELTTFMTDTARNARGMPLADHEIHMQQKVMPVLEQFVREDPNFINKASQHFADKYRTWGDAEAIARTDALFTDALSELQKATGPRSRSTPQRVAELRAKVGELQAERQARLGDTDPNLRHSIMDDDRATVQARLQQSSQDPKIKKLENDLHRLYDISFDEAAMSGALSAAEARRMKMDVRKGNYHLTDNPLAQKTWVQQGKHWVEKHAVENSHIVNSDPSAVLSLYRSANRERVRKGYMNANQESRFTPAPGFSPHPRVNNPRDPFSELAHMDIRVRQAAAHNRALRDYTDMMMKSPGNANRQLLDIVKVIPEKEIPQNISWIEKKITGRANDTSGFHYAYRGENGSLVLVRHNEKHVQEALKFAPAAVVPIANQSRKVLQAMTTGPGHPMFGLAVSNPYDFLTGSLLRHNSMAFGPISFMAHRMFGMGSPAARIISAIAAGPEAAINVFASYPYYLIKSVTSEFFGNIMAKRIEADLAANVGIGKIPGAATILGPVAKVMSKAYDASMTNLTKVYKVGHVANGSDEILSLIRDINSITKRRPEWKSGANAYLSMLQVALDVPKHMALSQNLKLFNREVKLGKQQAAYMSKEFIAEQARQIGGDMARISGNKTIQQIVSVMPWSNPGIQSLRYMKQRLMENPVENTARLMSFGFVAAWAYNYVASDKESNDWFFNQLPNDIRTKSIPFPNPSRYIRRMMGINVPRGTPEEEHVLVPIAPEMMTFILPFIHGARALGLIENKDVVAPQTLMDDMKHARDAMFGLATPPIVQGIMGLFGKKIEPGKVLSGESPVRDIRDPNFGAANKDKMSPQSRIPHALHDGLTGLLGTTIGNVLEAGNYGDIHARSPKGSLEEGVKQGVSKFITTQTAGAPGAHHIWPEANRRYIYTPIAEQRQKDFAILKGVVESQMPAEAGLRRALNPHAKPNTLEQTDTAPGAVVGSPVKDPDVRVLIGHVHKALFTNPYKQLEDQRKIERSKHEAMTIGADPSSPDSPLLRYRAAQEQAKKVNALDRQLYTIYQDQWKMMKSSPSGKAFEQKFGPLTPGNLARAVQESAREQGDEQPR